MRNLVAALALLALGSFACGKLAPEDGRMTSIARPEDEESKKATPAPSSTDSNATGSGDPTGPVARRTDLTLQTYSSQSCRFFEACGLSSSAIFNGTWGTQEKCEADKEEKLSIQLALPGVTVTQAQIDVCAARQAQVPCEQHLAECAFKGTLANHAVCEIDAQCASGRCELDGDTLCGTCAPRGQTGDGCEYGFECEAGLTCNEVTRKCMSPLPAGAACVADEGACGPGLACASGTCRKAPSEGETCEGRNWVHFGYYGDCGTGTYCKQELDAPDGVCVKFPRTAQKANVGEACGPGISCLASTCDDASHVCVARNSAPARPACK